MGDVVHPVILGAVQGLTEFLPVSSDGHLLLARHLFGLADEGLSFDAALHLGTALALLVVFWSTWMRLCRALVGRGDGGDRRLLGQLVVATLPGVVVGLLAEHMIGGVLRSLPVTVFGFLVSAGFLWAADHAVRTRERAGSAALVSLSTGKAVIIGVAQVLALLPGLSRSGTTMGTGVVLGLDRARAVEFSFLLAFPITAGAGLLGVFREDLNGGLVQPSFLLAFGSAFVFGLLAVRFLLQYVRRHAFRPFIAYLLAVAFLAVVLSR